MQEASLRVRCICLKTYYIYIELTICNLECLYLRTNMPISTHSVSVVRDPKPVIPSDKSHHSKFRFWTIPILQPTDNS